MDASREMDADDLLGAAGATGDPLSALDGCDFGYAHARQRISCKRR